jgi:hypothetical protein
MGTWALTCFSLVFCFNFPAIADLNEFANPRAGQQTVASCQNFLNSGKCDKFKGQPGALEIGQCQAEVSGDNWSVLSRLANCGAGLRMSAGTLWENLKSIGSSTISAAGGIYNYLTDGDVRSATHESIRESLKTAGEYLESVYPYIATEFQKTLAEANAKGGDPSVNSFGAAQSLAPKLMGKLMSAALEIIKAKYEDFHCFDNNKQVEMVCKVAGDLFIPPTAIFGLYKAGVKGLAALPKVSAKIEEMLKMGAKGEENIGSLATAKERALEAKAKAAEVLQDLRDAARNKKRDDNSRLDSTSSASTANPETMARLQKTLGNNAAVKHSLSTDRDGKVTLEIGMLRRNQKEFMVAATKAIREGQVQVVDAGHIVGPKVLATMKDFSETVSKGNKNGVQFRGKIHGNRIRTTFQDQLEMKLGSKLDNGASNPYSWTQREIENYRRAVKELKLDEACRRYYGSAPCGELYFEYDARYPEKIKWRAP